MNVSIVTVYDSINCGSFWQAYALGKELNRLGYSVVYWKRKRDFNSSSSLYNISKGSIKCFINEGFTGVSRYFKGIKEFKKLQRDFKIISDKTAIDCFVLGSDTIWDLNNRFFKSNYTTYWGIDFLPLPIISYAASAANTKSSDVTDEMLKALSSFSSISVRDEYTHDLIKSSHSDIRLVCDPTILLSVEDYKSQMNSKREKKYIYLYLFQPLSAESMQALKRISNDNDLLIVCGGAHYKNSLCDEFSIVSPKQFITDIYYADYIITDTFHGTVFSILFNKQFVSINRSKNKISELLRLFGLEDRLVDCNIAEALSKQIEYTCVNSIIQKIRDESENYLKYALDKIKNK